MSMEDAEKHQPSHPANSWFPKDNFWRVRASKGADLIFSSPQLLWEACLEYFDWVVNNPLYAADVVKYMGEATITAVPKMRIMTVGTLCIFLGVTRKTWYNYKDRPEFTDVCEQVEEIMKGQNLAGASSDMLNANIISRLLGLVDKQNVEQSGPGGRPIENKWIIEIVEPKPEEG